LLLAVFHLINICTCFHFSIKKTLSLSIIRNAQPIEIYPFRIVEISRTEEPWIDCAGSYLTLSERILRKSPHQFKRLKDKNHTLQYWTKSVPHCLKICNSLASPLHIIHSQFTQLNMAHNHVSVDTYPR